MAAHWIVDGDNGIPYNILPENKEQLKEEMRYETFIFDKDGMPEKMRLAMVVWNAGTYFYDGNIEKVVITGAEWMEKGKEKTYVNLTTGEVRNLPENAVFTENGF